MGYLAASDMAAHTTTQDPRAMYQTMHWHLRSNHVPPHPIEMIDPAIDAVTHARNGDWDSLIETPHPHREYGHNVPVHTIVDALNLDGFID